MLQQLIQAGLCDSVFFVKEMMEVNTDYFRSCIEVCWIIKMPLKQILKASVTLK